jgi:indole-3-glycerol phosphate synthase
MDLAPLAPDNQIIVSESGIHNKEDILFLKQAGIQAVLVGTSIMKSHDVKGKVKELVRAGRR